MNFFRNKLASIDKPNSTESGFKDLDAYAPSVIVMLEKLVSKFSDEEIIEFLKGTHPDIANLLEEELGHGRNGGRSTMTQAIGQVKRVKTADSLHGMHRLHRLADEGALAVAWPVPHHIVENVFDELTEGRHFAAEDHLPPHLEELDLDIRALDDMLPEEVKTAFNGIKGILADGRNRAGRITTRRSIVRVLQVLQDQDITLFLHPIPHPPPHAEFADVGAAIVVIEVH